MLSFVRFLLIFYQNAYWDKSFAFAYRGSENGIIFCDIEEGEIIQDKNREDDGRTSKDSGLSVHNGLLQQKTNNNSKSGRTTSKYLQRKI